MPAIPIPAYKIVVLEEARPPKTKSGLVANYDDDRNKPQLGKVVKIGWGLRPVNFKVGDILIYARWMDSRVQVGEKEYIMLMFKDILGVLPHEAA
jgi:co-chaperonin GroES (HSP10)